MFESKLNGESLDILEENISKLREIFPEIVTEDKIDFDNLKQIMGEYIEESDERYNFTWNGKGKSIKLAQSPSTGTLRPCKEESKDWDRTENLYIEGDNLEVLKLLQKSYYGKIKMIYIDPPYNTGKDFIYPDNYNDNLENYLEMTGQIFTQGSENIKLTTNTEASGRYHTNWLNMMYPRLKLARNLLSDDGVIFISIDDNELNNLKKLCDEIFGEENFICNFVRKNKAGSGHDSKRIAIEFDYIICYCKNINQVKINQEHVKVDQDRKYKFSDEFVERRGKYYLRDLDYKGSYSEKMDYPIEAPDGTNIYSGGQSGKPNTWRWSKEKFKWGIEKNFIEFKKKQDKWKVYIKQYQFVDNNDKKYVRQIPYRALIDFSNGQGTLDFNKIMETDVFSFPKPVNLLEYLLNVGSDKNSIVLDFFAGSSTTVNAVIGLNSKNKENRKFILVQIPEETDEKSEAFKAGYKNIAEIGKERIRRAGNKIKSEPNNKDLDVGFKVFKLDSSNLNKWNPDYENIEQTILNSPDNIVPGRIELDLVYEIILK
ncbi:MAG: site-specific DNA-methyltransferase, partial [Methanobrevibacter sp.]|nr:site-specific DNA-methyltransferase [Candidatus Methanovirga meridionalis]